MKQIYLNQSQLSQFHIDDFASLQLEYFQELTKGQQKILDKKVVDVGGGSGFFAKKMVEKYPCRVKVIDMDKEAPRKCNEDSNYAIEGFYGDALSPPISGDEGVICFNLVLHHLVGNDNIESTHLQKNAISCWKDQAEVLFVTEYIYESFIKNISGRLIYEITSSKVLSSLAKLVSRFVPALRANTFYTGVRFRSHEEWIGLFKSCGYEVISSVLGTNNNVSLPLRLLLIKHIRVDGFLLRSIKS